jgi:hypothetical protein
MRETPSQDHGDGRATGQSSRGTAGLDLRPFGLRPCRTGRRRRQGWSAALSASGASTRSECLKCFLRRVSVHAARFPDLPPDRGGGRNAQRKNLIPDPRPLTPAASMARLCAFADLSASGGADLPASAHSSRPAYGPEGRRSPSLHPHRAFSSERRTAISAVAAGGSYIVRARRLAERAREATPVA